MVCRRKPSWFGSGLIARIGILVFGPAFKEQKEAREQMQYVLLRPLSWLPTRIYWPLHRQALEGAPQIESSQVALKDSESSAIQATAVKSPLKSAPWWSSLSLWSRETNTGSGKPRDELPTTKQKPDKEWKSVNNTSSGKGDAPLNSTALETEQECESPRRLAKTTLVEPDNLDNPR